MCVTKTTYLCLCCEIGTCNSCANVLNKCTEATCSFISHNYMYTVATCTCNTSQSFAVLNINFCQTCFEILRSNDKLQVSCTMYVYTIILLWPVACIIVIHWTVGGLL